MKLLAETTGEFLLHDLSTGQTLQSSRPSVIARSGFIDARIALSQITKIADVPDQASDEDFADYWATSEGDRDLAIASYLSTFEQPAAPEPKKRSK